MLFVPSYFDFVRVRDLLTKEEIPFATISEYTTTKQVSRARSAMQQGTVPLLLYTERAHFFRRHKLRGARHLAVYSPPTYAHFYTELLQVIHAGSCCSHCLIGSSTHVLAFLLSEQPLQMRTLRRTSYRLRALLHGENRKGMCDSSHNLHHASSLVLTFT